MNALPFKRAAELGEEAAPPAWLIEGLWAQEAVGILGGEPKCCKSFLALDIAVAVASGTACLRRFPVRQTGPVLLFPAEDALGLVRQRLAGICAAAATPLETLPLYVITAPRLRLDLAEDRQRLRQTLAQIKPRLLVLDPFIRLHGLDENASKDVAPLLGYLRELQREFRVAVLLVHHVRKGSAKDRPGQALRGSSDLHGWGDSNLYLRRHNHHLVLSVEQRAAPSPEDILIDLAADGPALALRVLSAAAAKAPPAASPAERVVQTLRQLPAPVSAQQLRRLCRLRTATLCQTLNALRHQNLIRHGPKGYSLPDTHNEKPVSLPPAPIGHPGNGNGKHPQLPLAFNPQLA